MTSIGTIASVGLYCLSHKVVYKLESYNPKENEKTHFELYEYEEFP